MSVIRGKQKYGELSKKASPVGGDSLFVSSSQGTPASKIAGRVIISKTLDEIVNLDTRKLAETFSSVRVSAHKNTRS